jgi:glutathione S-transferase
MSTSTPKEVFMKLYSGPLSLFSRKVEIALHEKGLAFERVMVPFNQTHGYSPKHPDVLTANPKGQVPVLVDGDLTLYDSTVIVEYLEDAYPNPALLPRTAAQRAQCRQLELYADEVMLVPLRALMHRTGPQGSDPLIWSAAEDKAKAAEEALAGQLSWLQTVLGAKAFMGDAFGIADIALFMTVLYTQRLGGPAIAGYPVLRAWFERLRARSAFSRIEQEIMQADRELSQPVTGASWSAWRSG